MELDRARGEVPPVSDAVLTIPNLITFARLALIPLFVWLGVGPKQMGAAFAVGFVAGSTDFVDGKIARRLGQVSQLGIALDPLSDRLALAGAAAVLISNHLAPLWAVLAVVVRDAILLIGVPILSARGVPRPAVSFAGKSATMGIMWAFGFFFAAAITIPATGWLRTLGWICYWPGLALSYVAGAGYVHGSIRSLRSA
jgi:cardiolipin synthase